VTDPHPRLKRPFVTEQSADDAGKGIVEANLALQAARRSGQSPRGGKEQAAFSVIREAGCHLATVRVSGEVDLETAPELREALFAVISDGATHVVVDVGDVSFIDASGFNALVAAHMRLRGQGRGLALRAPSPMARRALEATGLDRFIDVLDF